jgi:hypothetical protein
VGLEDGGLLRVRVPDDKAQGVPAGRPVRFQLSLDEGEVRALAEIVRAEKSELLLRLTQIENDEGLPRLLAYLHAHLTR